MKAATVMRVWPTGVQVSLREREPVAFAREGDRMELIAADGVLLPTPAQSHYGFPVLTGLAPAVAGRRGQVGRYLEFRDAVHGGTVSEVNLSRADDLSAEVVAPGGGTVLVHFGDAHYAARFALFQTQIAGWQQKYPNLKSVDLHFDGQAIVDPGVAPSPPTPAPTVKKKSGRGRPGA